METEMIKRYTDQPEILPEELRTLVRKNWNGAEILLYSFLDLNEFYQLESSWICLGRENFCLAKKNQDGSWRIDNFARKALSRISEIPSLSCHRLVLEFKEGTSLVLRSSFRQSRTMAQFRFLLEQGLEVQKSSEGLANSGTNSASSEALTKSSDQIYQDEVLAPIKEAQASITGNQVAVVWRLMGFLYPYRAQVALGMLGAVVMTLVSLLPPFLTGYLVDHVIKPFQSGSLSIEAAKELVFVTISALVLVYSLREFFAWIRLKTMSVMGEYVATDLRDKVYTHLQKLSLSYFSSKQTGSLISRVGSDTDRIWDFIAFGVVEVFTSLLMLSGLGVVLLYMDWRLGLLVTVPVPLILWSIARHGNTMQGLFLRVWRRWSNMTDCLSDTIPGIRVVKAFHREDFEVAKFQSRNQDFLEACNRVHKVWTSFWPILMLGIQSIVIAVWVFGVPRVLDHVEVFRTQGIETGLSPGTFIAFLLYLGMFVQPIEVIGQMARMVNRATSSAHRVFEVLDTEPQVTVQRDAVKIENFMGEVRFEKVGFSYDGVRNILKDVDFHIRPGEMIGLVGPSGSGKTTITNLLARFYDVSRGSIKVDGVDLRELDIGDFRKQLGMVLQDPFLFHGSILENIRYAKPEAGLDEVVAAAQAANAHDFICRLPYGYETLIGERGQSLSGGERQRVSIARAILRNPKLLILDEATSSVDTETERKIQDALDRLIKGRTVIAIAHRLSTLVKADRILVIEKGVLKEEGSHNELLQKEGLYAKLVKMQQDLQRIQ